ncbi:MAG TPA: 16S rRNA (cytosine(967)-C(5))-methyltransferase RsmB [Thermoanaerobaculia bacterium]|jgi:16S rRNA (cytosine967-C5)-methyltransferase|nr:16S rRNA (cytosine(967)-C(5))-methyltransferase RsmB [Thermoanaerobaculia bacterium]
MSSRSASPARVRAVEILRQALRRGAEVPPLLATREADLSPADRDLLREIVYGVLRHRAPLDAELASVSRAPLARLERDLREILEVALYQIRRLDRVPAYAAVDEAVRQARESGGERAAKLVNAVLRRLAERPAPPTAAGTSPADLARASSHPEFLVKRWVERFGRAEACRILESDNASSAIDLLVNPRRTDREALREALAAEGVETEASRVSRLGLTVTAGNPLRSPLLAEGHFTVQDVGAQALSLLLPPGDLLVDLAAAPGGKTFAALALGRARRAIALDRSTVRLARFADNARRLGMPEALPVTGDFLSPPLPDGRFDRVIFDAPCSGTGTLRKNPEIRYRVSPAAIEKLARTQARALSRAADLLAPGGYLLYATCSLEAEENERVVEEVLAERPELSLAEIEPPEPLRPFVAGARFRLLPDERTDGFTAHLLRRR